MLTAGRGAQFFFSHARQCGSMTIDQAVQYSRRLPYSLPAPLQRGTVADGFREQGSWTSAGFYTVLITVSRCSERRHPAFDLVGPGCMMPTLCSCGCNVSVPHLLDAGAGGPSSRIAPGTDPCWKRCPVAAAGVTPTAFGWPSQLFSF